MQFLRIFFAFAIVFLFIGVGVLGLGMNMTKDVQGHMSRCPFVDSSTSICTMNPLEHISSVESLLTTLAPINVILFLTLFVITFSLLFFYNPESQNRKHHLSRFQSENNIDITPLAFAFSQGILHPKVYSAFSIS